MINICAPWYTLSSIWRLEQRHSCTAHHHNQEQLKRSTLLASFWRKKFKKDFLMVCAKYKNTYCMSLAFPLVTCWKYEHKSNGEINLFTVFLILKQRWHEHKQNTACSIAVTVHIISICICPQHLINITSLFLYGQTSGRYLLEWCIQLWRASTSKSPKASAIACSFMKFKLWILCDLIGYICLHMCIQSAGDC